ncbi:sensor histidine kinase [Clostridium felsineum]|uniref:sensor histidine kinase n=1 Tax=Clostridium felsineum TaxID=36839 RepID=UPI00214D1E60|nr:sensor histidine kinase [Clostridium felsineum]MCR3759557.1 sensor histidine kinase [Clostridium felsineum]
MNTFFSSSKDRRAAFRIVQFFIIISIFKASIQNGINILNLIALILLCFNDLLRDFIKYPLRYVSCAISNLLLLYIAYTNTGTEIIVYAVLLSVEIILLNKEIIKSLLIINFATYYVASGILYSNNPIHIFLNGLTNYILTILVSLLFKGIIKEKVKAENLNKELNETNLKLEKYAKKIEELTIEKERTRIAQELHDSIGHSLVALNMNLEYTENIIEIKPEKAKLVVKNCYKISKECLQTLRKVVNLLKETSNKYNLNEEIHKIFDNFKNTSQYKFNLKYDNTVEKIESTIKICIFKTVREAITNGVKHGKATIFTIDIYKKDNYIHFKITNNGQGINSSDIIKSNGLIGMEQRINEFNGDIFFSSPDKTGFIVEGKIPFKILEEIPHD